MPKLTITTGDNVGKAYPLGSESLIIGRAPDVSISIQDPRASRRHATILRIESDFYIEDLQSQNGTFLNGQIIKQRCCLRDKDILRVGNTNFTFVLQDDVIDVNSFFCGYQIMEKVLEEPTSKIFVAEQKELQRPVLLWVLEIGQQDQLSTHTLFIENIAKIAHLFHPNLMMLLDFATYERYCLCAFEKVSLKNNLQNYIKQNPNLPIIQILEIACQISSALEYSHSHGVYHLHLSSKNVLVQTEPTIRVILSEFGVSMFLDATGMFSSSTFSVSWEYLAPEQILCQGQPDHRSDIYAFGCILYRLLAGINPFPAESASALSRLHRESTPPSLKEKRPDIPESLVKLIEQCLAKNIDDRISSFKEIGLELAKIRQDLEKTDTPIPVLKPVVLIKWWFIFPILAMILGMIGFIAVTFLL